MLYIKNFLILRYFKEQFSVFKQHYLHFQPENNISLVMNLLLRKKVSPRFRALTYRHVAHPHCILFPSHQTESENRLMVEYPWPYKYRNNTWFRLLTTQTPPGSPKLSLSLSQLFHIIINHAIIFSPKII